jgi:hypothetical protein
MDSTSSVPAPSSQSSSKALQGSNNAGESAAHAKAIKQNWLQGQVPPVLEHTSYTCSLAANGGDEHDTNHAPDQVTNSTTGPMDRPQIPAAESLVWTRKYLLSLGVYLTSTIYKTQTLILSHRWWRCSRLFHTTHTSRAHENLWVA